MSETVAEASDEVKQKTAALMKAVVEATTDEERKAAQEALQAYSAEQGKVTAQATEDRQAKGDRQLTRIRQRDERIAEAQRRD